LRRITLFYDEQGICILDPFDSSLSNCFLIIFALLSVLLSIYLLLMDSVPFVVVCFSSWDLTI